VVHDKSVLSLQVNSFREYNVPTYELGFKQTFAINSGIVEVLIADMFFHPDDHGGASQKAASKPFIKKEDHHEFRLVESDFSILGWEKDEYRLSMTDLSFRRHHVLQAV
jgi:hypothetical protein